MGMNTNRPASRHGVPVLLGNLVTIADGRRGVVDEIVGDQVVVEVVRPRASRVALFAGFEYLTIDAAEVAHAA